ncbi:MAG: DUF2330 domain-containing protein [Planctomycetaceae bacterium]
MRHAAATADHEGGGRGWWTGACWLTLVFTTAAAACMAVGESGRSVAMREEQAILIWDSQRQTEHFLRRATFQTSGESLAFLVPTPTVPRFTEVDNTIFDQLASLTAPRIEVRKRARSWGCAAPPTTGATLEGPNTLIDAVQVHSRTQLTGQEVVVLSAENPEELSAWLKGHGFPTTDRLTDWLRPYVRQGWKISAFRYTQGGATPGTPGAEEKSPAGETEVAGARADQRPDGGAGEPARPVQSLKMPAVCISFQTATPFYPYREPLIDTATDPLDRGAPPPPRRTLRLYCFATERLDGFLSQTRRLWAGQTAWSKRLDLPVLGGLNPLRGIAGLDLLEVPHLTEFEDLSQQRPDGLDVEFEPARSQATVERPPIIREVAQHGPGGDLVSVALLGLVLLRRWQRRG